MGSALKFKQANVPRQQGEQARLKILQGPDYGSIFVIIGTKATIGRGDENDVMISDLKASRRHAEISLGQKGWVVNDLGSSNGILYAGKATRTTPLRNSDAFTLGETTLEFVSSSDAGTAMLIAPPKSAAEFQAQQSALEAQRNKILSLGVPGGMPGGGARGDAAMQLLGNPKLLLGLGVAAALYYAMDTGPSVFPKKASGNRDLASFLPAPAQTPGDSPTEKAAETFFKEGFREYVNHNYLRAKTQFESVIQVSPAHSLARMYLQNCDEQIKGEVKFLLEHGKKNLDAGKIKTARGQFEAVLRLLYRDQSNPAYLDAKEQLDKLANKSSGSGGSG